MKIHCIKRASFILFCLLIVGCHNKPIEIQTDNVELVVDEHSHVYNLTQGIYTTRMIGNKEIQTDFPLSGEEYHRLIRLYSSLGLNGLGDSCSLLGDCERSPMNPTRIILKAGEKRQVIVIDVPCDRFSIFEREKAKKVKLFLDTYTEIIRAKPAYRQLPTSDYFYF